MQNLNFKTQNHKSNFKIEFQNRLLLFSISIVNLSKLLRKDPNYWIIVDQILRSATSIGANIIEAKASSSKKEYIRYFEIALKSANETQYWMLIIEKTVTSNILEIQRLKKEIKEISNIIASGIITMKGKRNP